MPEVVQQDIGLRNRHPVDRVERDFPGAGRIELDDPHAAFLSQPFQIGRLVGAGFRTAPARRLLRRLLDLPDTGRAVQFWS